MTTEEKDNVRESIVDAACDLFGKFGYKKTTMDDVALASRKGKTAIYYYYKNKDEIFRAVIEREAKQLADVIEKAVSIHSNPVEKLKAYVIARMQALQNVATFYDAMKNELLDHLSFMDQTREAYEKSELETVRKILLEGNKNGQFKIKRPEATAITIVTLLKGLEIPFFIQTKPEDVEEKVKNLLDIICFGIVNRAAKK